MCFFFVGNKKSFRVKSPNNLVGKALVIDLESLILFVFFFKFYFIRNTVKMNRVKTINHSKISKKVG